MTTVPPIDLYVGDRDITVADCQLLRDRLAQDHIRYHEERGAVNVYPLLPTPEGRAARRDTIAHIKTALNDPRPWRSAAIRFSRMQAAASTAWRQRSSGRASSAPQCMQTATVTGRLFALPTR